MNFDAIGWAEENMPRTLTKRARRVLIELAIFADSSGRITTMEYKLRSSLSYTRRGFQLAIAELRLAGLIVVDRIGYCLNWYK